MGDCDLTDEEYFEQPKSQEEIEMDNIWKECNIPLENNIRLDQTIGKTIKFCAKTEKRKNNTILIIFTDYTFLIINSGWEDITDSVSSCMSQDEDYQNLMIKGGLISQEKVDKYNNYWNGRKEFIQKENDIELLKKLLEKYPEYKK